MNALLVKSPKGNMMAKKKSETFAARMNQLEKIVEQLESDTLDLEDAVSLFEKGVKLTKECNKMLREAEKKVEILLKEEDGKIAAADFDPALEEDEPDE